MNSTDNQRNPGTDLIQEAEDAYSHIFGTGTEEDTMDNDKVELGDHALLCYNALARTMTRRTYVDWTDGEACEVVTPFLDNHHDSVTVTVAREEHNYIVCNDQIDDHSGTTWWEDTLHKAMDPWNFKCNKEYGIYRIVKAPGNLGDTMWQLCIVISTLSALINHHLNGEVT